MTDATEGAAAVIRGGCLCGAVAIEIDGPLGSASHCHCSMCRKAHGAAFATYATVMRDRFRLVSGADSLERYRSSAEVVRSFCRRCGSSLLYEHDRAPRRVEVAMGALDGDPGARPSRHIHTAGKAPWYDIRDPLPQHAELPPRAAAAPPAPAPDSN